MIEQNKRFESVARRAFTKTAFAKTALAICGGLLSMEWALADQCAWLDASEQKYVYKSAKRLLLAGGDFVDYCKPCGDAMGKVQSVSEVRIEAPELSSRSETAFREVRLNGTARDLAYLYVRTGSRVFTNVALLVGCPATDVPPVLYTAPGKSPSPVSWDDVAAGRRQPSSVKPEIKAAPAQSNQ